jgi:serine protease Do
MKRWLLALVMVGMLVGFVNPAAVRELATPAVVAQAAVTSNVALSGSDIVAALENTTETIYQNVSPSVVYIEVSSAPQSTAYRSRGQRFQFQTPLQQSSGSGFVWDKQGDIVTNNHVVEGAMTIQVTFSDGTTVPATLLGADANSDLAVIQVSVSADKLQPVTLADSTQVKVGQLTIAIGNPFGLESTMTVGYVSGLGRSLSSVNQRGARASYGVTDLIQTDAPIKPGNSGGVLLNSSGQVIGVTNAIVSTSGSSSGVGFAIPASTVAKTVPTLISTGKVP